MKKIIIGVLGAVTLIALYATRKKWLPGGGATKMTLEKANALASELDYSDFRKPNLPDKTQNITQQLKNAGYKIVAHPMGEGARHTAVAISPEDENEEGTKPTTLKEYIFTQDATLRPPGSSHAGINFKKGNKIKGVMVRNTKNSEPPNYIEAATPAGIIRIAYGGRAGSVVEPILPGGVGADGYTRDPNLAKHTTWSQQTSDEWTA